MAEANKGEAHETVIVQNRKARHDFEVLDRFETGIVLRGTEVKALRDGLITLKDSFAAVERGEVFLYNVHISQYKGGNNFNHETERVRKLLLHRNEIRKLTGKTEQQGLTLVPLKIYFKRGKVKVDLGLVRGKKEFDKRHSLAKRQADRDVERALKDRHK
ncbi:MAG TPA: SsrA-binding protein SmpB [Candidatus Latescibacteria bacterium]|nr:SsrA-binding protein SmpB [Candidatus Latescibacterota bacterium]